MLALAEVKSGSRSSGHGPGRLLLGALALVLAAPTGCSSDDGDPADAGGDGAGGSVADAAAADAPRDAIRPDTGIPVTCAVNVTVNTYSPEQPGCAGIATCRGVIQYSNNSGLTLNYPNIGFSVPSGVTCLRTHSNSRWIVSDDGAISGRCVFATNPSAMPWNVLPGNSFRFGYDLTDGANPPVPTDVVVSDLSCGSPVPDAGGSGTPDAAAPSPDSATPEARPADAGGDSAGSGG